MDSKYQPDSKINDSEIDITFQQTFGDTDLIPRTEPNVVSLVKKAKDLGMLVSSVEKLGASDQQYTLIPALLEELKINVIFNGLEKYHTISLELSGTPVTDLPTDNKKILLSALEHQKASSAQKLIPKDEIYYKDIFELLSIKANTLICLAVLVKELSKHIDLVADEFIKGMTYLNFLNNQPAFFVSCHNFPSKHFSDIESLEPILTMVQNVVSNSSDFPEHQQRQKIDENFHQHEIRIQETERKKMVFSNGMALGESLIQLTNEFIKGPEKKS